MQDCQKLQIPGANKSRTYVIHLPPPGGGAGRAHRGAKNPHSTLEKCGWMRINPHMCGFSGNRTNPPLRICQPSCGAPASGTAAWKREPKRVAGSPLLGLARLLGEEAGSRFGPTAPGRRPALRGVAEAFRFSRLVRLFYASLQGRARGRWKARTADGKGGRASVWTKTPQTPRCKRIQVNSSLFASVLGGFCKPLLGSARICKRMQGYFEFFEFTRFATRKRGDVPAERLYKCSAARGGAMGHRALPPPRIRSRKHGARRAYNYLRFIDDEGAHY